MRTPKIPDSELSVSQAALARQIREASDEVRVSLEVALERAREIALKEIADKRAMRDMLVRQAYSDGLDGGWRKGKGLSAASIKRAMKNSDHRSLMDIINSSALAPLRRGPDFTLLPTSNAKGFREVLVNWYTLPTGETVVHEENAEPWVVEPMEDQRTYKTRLEVLAPEDVANHDEFTKRNLRWAAKDAKSYQEWYTDFRDRVLDAIDREGY